MADAKKVIDRLGGRIGVLESQLVIVQVDLEETRALLEETAAALAEAQAEVTAPPASSE